MTSSPDTKKRRVSCNQLRAQAIESMLDGKEMYMTEIAQRFGVSVATIEPVILHLHREQKIYIAERAPSGPAATAFRWALGNKPDAPRVLKEEKEVSAKRAEVKPKTVVNVHRDPFIEAMYGSAA